MIVDERPWSVGVGSIGGNAWLDEKLGDGLTERNPDL